MFRTTHTYKIQLIYALIIVIVIIIIEFLFLNGNSSATGEI
jgi:hypothetical protein